MKVRGKLVIFLLGVLTFGAGVAALAGCRQTAPSPQQAGIALAKAMEVNDQSSVHNLAIGTDAQFEYIGGMSVWLVAYKNYETAFANKYPLDPKPFLESSQKMVTQMENADETINGDWATLVARSGGSLVLSFHKSQGQWKLDLSSLCDDAEAAKQITELHKLAGAYDASREDLQAGKTNTPDEARADLKHHIDEVLVTGYRYMLNGKQIGSTTTQPDATPARPTAVPATQAATS
jgi:hypothetical protein